MTLEHRIKDIKKAHLLLNLGNRGDGLIYAGAYALLNRLGIQITEVKPREEASGDVLFVIGSGAFCSYYNDRAIYITKYYDKFKEIIIFPTTFDTSNDVISNWARNLPSHVTVFCREMTSFYKMSELCNRVFIDHDTAFHLNLDQWKKAGEGVLMAWRRDKESDGTHIGGEDVSQGSEKDWLSMVTRVAEFRVIHTDRLHVAIAGYLLGKEVHVYPCNYFKVKAMYDYSLKGKVSWC